MKKYIVEVYGGSVTVAQTFESNSRNSKKHISDTGADHCSVFTKGGKQVSAATRWGDGKITNVTF